MTSKESKRSSLEMPSESLQSALVSLVSDTSFEDLPETAVKAAETVLADSIAIGLAGKDSPFRDALLAAVLPWGDGGNCRVLGSDDRLPAATAAYMNAFQMHCLEFDAVHEGAVAHVATTPLAALLAEVDLRNEAVSGAKFLTAFSVGIEVAATLGMAADAPLQFFRPATTGVFGAAAAIASLREFDHYKTQQAFGYALSEAAGTMQPHEEGMPTLPVQMAAAARAGLIAADLAGTDIPTVGQAIEGKFGYLSMFESKVSTDGLVERLANPWRVTELSLKPFASGRATHGGVEAILAMRARGLSAENLASAELVAPPLIDKLVNRPAHAGMNPNYARLCFPYVAALSLKEGRVPLSGFSREALTREDRLALANRIRVRRNDEDDPSSFTPQELTAVRKDGEHMRIRVQHLLGSPNHPMTVAARKEKIIECMTAVNLDAARAEELMALTEGIGQSTDCRALLNLVAVHSL